jgi:hypothetical protein
MITMAAILIGLLGLIAIFQAFIMVRMGREREAMKEVLKAAALQGRLLPAERLRLKSRSRNLVSHRRQSTNQF